MRGLLLFVAMAAAMTFEQSKVCRDTMRKLKVPPWSIMIDATLGDQLAFSQQDSHITYLDAARFVNTLNTWRNVVAHEASHLKGAQHGDGSLGMSYSVTLDPFGNVLNDPFLILPLP